MSEFVKTMRDWKRLCDKMDNKYGIGACTNCPLFSMGAKRSGCDAINTDWAANIDWDKFASIVDAWAAENPEPVYPTWAEWLKEQDIVAVDVRPLASSTTSGSSTYIQNVSTKPAFYRPIPADIAEKLGLKPKGGDEND